MPFPKELAAPTYAQGTAPVGTPVKVFEPYKAPAFTSPAVPVGGVVTSLTLQSTSAADQANVPFTFAQPFKKGDLAPDCALVGAIQGKPDLPLQVNVKATHSDGSVRHAIISGVLPSLSVGASMVMGLKRVTANGGTSVVAAPDKLAAFTVVIAGVTYSASSDLSKARLTHFSGPVASDQIIDVPFVDTNGVAHPTLTAQFSVRAYSNRAVRVDAAIENCKAYQSTTDITYDVTLSANGAAVYSQTGLVHTPAARWKKQFWYGAAPALHIKHDTAYLIASRAVPNYDQTIKYSETTLAGYAAKLAANNFGPMGFGTLQPAMGTTGGRPDIGIMPDTYVATILSMDKRAKDIMLATADIGGSWPGHYRDDSSGPNKGMPLSVLNFPYASIYGNTSDCLNYATGKNEHLPALTTATKGGFDSSHQPGLYYLPYLLTGDYFYLEGLHFWNAWNIFQSNPNYRLRSQGLVSPDQVRGQGWSLRTLGECAYITPDDHPSKQSYIYFVESNLAWYNTRYTDGTDNQLGVITGGAMVDNNGTGMRSWQDDFFVQGLNHLVELLDFDSAKRLLKWKAKFTVDRLMAPGTCIQNAAPYTLIIRASSTSPYFATMGECMDATIPATQRAYACNSPERLAMMSSKCLPGDIDGYPSSTEGYPANYQPALAAAADCGYPDGLTAWKMFAARPTKPDYSLGAQFAIMPRLVTEVVAAPSPTPAPDPAPAPAPTPAPAPAPTPVAGTIRTPSNIKLVRLTGLSMTAFNPSTLALVKLFTGLTASSKGALAVKDAALVPGTTYAAAVSDSAGKVLDVMYPLTAV